MENSIAPVISKILMNKKKQKKAYYFILKDNLKQDGKSKYLIDRMSSPNINLIIQVSINFHVYLNANLPIISVIE